MESLVTVDPAFWRGKRVFLTGHTGFKGAWLALWLTELGARVEGFALAPETEPNLFRVARVSGLIDSKLGDIRDLPSLAQTMTAFDPDVVFHLAAQPLVLKSYEDPVGTYATNVMGTVHILEAARACPRLRVIVAVTTDKCYENRNWVWSYREDDPMGGHDPYSNSKGCAELVAQAYRRSFFNSGAGPFLASARAGNVIGGGDWAADRLVPDILRSFDAAQTVVLRYPEATRPWQHVLEPLSGYLVLAQALWSGGDDFAEAWNLGPRDEDARPVRWIVEELARCWGGDAGWERLENVAQHEALNLKLDISKARSRLGWSPRWGLDETLRRIVDWHRAWRGGGDMQAYCLGEIRAYSHVPSR